VEARTRKEVDEKREELRQLVGGSYRDLIDSADSIVEMSKTTQQVRLIGRSALVSHHPTFTRPPPAVFFLRRCEAAPKRHSWSLVSRWTRSSTETGVACAVPHLNSDTQRRLLTRLSVTSHSSRRGPYRP